MPISIGCEALRRQLCLGVHYDGFHRVVEVHACGFTRDGYPIMRVWQVRGGSVSGEAMGWKLLRFDEARHLNILDEASRAPRNGFQRGDRAMARVIAEL